jgi:hypothetical protein
VCFTITLEAVEKVCTPLDTRPCAHEHSLTDYYSTTLAGTCEREHVCLNLPPPPPPPPPQLFGIGENRAEDLVGHADQIIVLGCVGLAINLGGMCIFGGMCMCICMCVCARARVCVRVFVCVCVPKP